MQNIFSSKIYTDILFDNVKGNRIREFVTEDIMYLPYNTSACKFQPFTVSKLAHKKCTKHPLLFDLSYGYRLSCMVLHVHAYMDIYIFI